MPESRGSLARNVAIALGVPLLVAACAAMPPSLRSKDQAQATAEGPRGEFGPKPPVPGSVSPPSQTAEIKTFPGTGVFVNTKPVPPETAKGPEEASLNFEGLDIREVAKVILGDYLRESYTVHPAVTGTVTFRTVRPIPMKDLLPTLEMLLRQNNAAAVKEEGIYKILPITALRGSVSPQLGGSSLPIPPGFSVLVVPLKYVGAREMVHLLEPFAADNTIRADEVRNLVVLAGNERELKHLIETIDLFDVDWLSGYSVGLFPIKSADVKTLTGDLEKIFGAQAQSPLAGIVRIIPMERLNAILLVTTQKSYLDMARNWIDRLDTLGTTTGGTRFFVYQVKNGKAENLAQLVSDLFASRRTTTSAPTLAPGQRPTEIRSAPFGAPQPTPQTTTTTTTPAPAAATFTLAGAGTTANEVRVIADKDTNSLLILATPGDYEIITNALKQLDVVRRQVLVEVTLAEVELVDDLQFGLSYFIFARNRIQGVQGQQFLPPTGPTVAGTNTVPPGLASTGLQLINFTGSGDVRAVLNMLGTDKRSKLLASPQIMVLDNEKAEIKVGTRISVQTQTQTGVSTGTGVLNSFQYLETGILLAVTPRINSGGLVTLDINQEVSAPSSNPTATNPNPDVSTRNAKTSVIVASGESIVLGGLIQEKTLKQSNGIPLLSKIPVIGGLFGFQDLSRDRTELILVITPKIVSDTVQAREVTRELREKLPALEGMLPKLPTTPPADASATEKVLK